MRLWAIAVPIALAAWPGSARGEDDANRAGGGGGRGADSDARAPAVAPASDDEEASAAPGPPARPDGDAAAGVGAAVPRELDPEPVASSPSAARGAPAPPVEWSEWNITGEHLLDPPEVVEGFLDPVIERHRPLGEADRERLLRFLRELGYDAVIRTEPAGAGRVRAEIELIPVPRVRRVQIDFAGVLEQARHSVFEDDIRRRMRLRAGAELPRDPGARAALLQDEAERVEEYLKADGFFDAEVSIEDTPEDDPHIIGLEASVDTGPAYSVGAIWVEGNETIPDEEIAQAFRHARFCFLQMCVGERRFSRRQLGEDVEDVVEMYQRRGFPGARVRTTFDLDESFQRDTQTVEFEVIVNERRKIDVVFEGNSDRFSHDDLADVLTFADHGTYDDVTIESSAEEIRRYYQSRGYFEARVTWERERFEFFDRVLFSIEEGPRLRVRDVGFAGNRALPDGALRDVVRTSPFVAIGLFREGGYATSVQLRQDAQRLERFYRARGFREASVRARAARARALLDDPAALAAAVLGGGEADGLFVRFDIDEGPRIEIEEVAFDMEEAPSLSADDLRRVVEIRPGDPFVPDRVDQDQEAIARYYFERGYPRAEVETAAVETGNPGGRAIIHRVRENAQKRVGQIAVRGNFKTSDWILFQELELEEGDLLTAPKAQRAQANLRQSGLFSGVQLRYFGIEDAGRDTVDILVRVDERHDNLAALELGGGFSTDSLVFVEAVGRMDNIAGSGARFDARAQAGFEIQGAEANLVFPRWLMKRATGRPFLLETTGFWRRETTERFGNLESLGGSIAATREWRRGFFRNWMISLRYNFRQRNRDQELSRPPGASGDLREVPVRTRTSSLGPQLVIDKRRDGDGRINPLAPVQGYRLDLDARFAEDVFLGSDRFIKLGAAIQHYLPLGDRLRLANAVRYDHGIPLGGDVLLPEVERFFAGGDTTVRGFEEDRLATEIIEARVPPAGGRQFQVVPASGNIRFIHNLDLQLEVWELGPFPVATAVFVDSGLVTNSLRGLDRRALRHALGVSFFRYVTPFGSLSAEWAIPLDPRLGDDPRGRFHINVGATLQF